MARLVGTSFPFATLFENVSGSLVMGALVAYLAFKGEASQHLRLLLATGILGGYTTFSAFSLDAILLYERGELGLAALYVAASVSLSIAGLFAGLWIVRTFA
jgi:CrcB protein